MAYFRGLLVLNFVFFYDQNSTEIHLEYKDCHGDWLACDKGPDEKDEFGAF